MICVRHKLQELTDLVELFPFEQSRVGLVVVSQQFEDLCLFEIEAKCTHCNFELVIVYSAVSVCVKEVKGFLDLLLLFFCQSV